LSLIAQAFHSVSFSPAPSPARGFLFATNSVGEFRAPRKAFDTDVSKPDPDSSDSLPYLSGRFSPSDTFVENPG
jgi:hypothetical protein